MGRGGRGKIETDKVEILSGVRFGRTIGSPIALKINNLDYDNWQNKNASVVAPRPGHADLAGALKYHFDDIRNVIERSSARETVVRVVVGAICRKFLEEFDIKINSRIIQIGKVQWFKPLNSKDMEKVILEAAKRKDTLGGVIEVTAQNVPPGLGSYIQWDRRLEGKLAQVLMSIPSVKAVEIGEGIKNASLFGSCVHDEIYFDQDKNKYYRKTNRAGGIEGGISNGEDIICRIFLKPLSTLGKPLRTINIRTKKEIEATAERSDICAVPRTGVIGEAAVAFVLCEDFLEKFGGDSFYEIKRNFLSYLRYLSYL